MGVTQAIISDVLIPCFDPSGTDHRDRSTPTGNKRARFLAPGDTSTKIRGLASPAPASGLSALQEMRKA